MLHTVRPVLSIIIPTLNEAEHLPALLDDLMRQQQVSLEVVIGDGGSDDATRTIAEGFGVRFITARRGRGAQMNAAAAAASADYLLFLHADSRIDDPRLLRTAVDALAGALGENDRIAGHFRLEFMRTTARNAMAYRYAEEKTAFNRTGTTNGDQGMLLTKRFFRELGGFDESLPFLEDQRIAGKIRAAGTWITLPGCLKTSARRFEREGFHRRYILMGMMMGLHHIGAESFFTRAPGLYRTQRETGALLLTPFFTLIRHMMRDEWGFAGTLRTFYLLGRYIRQNSWQLFFFIDVLLRPLLGAGRYPSLAVHDRFVAPVTNFRILNVLTGMICFVWYLGILAPYFRLAERGEQMSGTSIFHGRQGHA